MPTIIPTQRSAFAIKSRHIVFSGLLSWQENVIGLQWFLTTCWPTINAACPKTTLYITGQMADPKLVKLAATCPNVVLMGFVPELRRIYRQCALAIAPIFINAGIKVKIITYLSFGLPVVANAEAVWGLIDTRGVVVTDKNHFTQSVIRVLQNVPLRKKLSSEGKKNVELHHSEKALRAFFVRAGVIS
jgi:glycosyltransferase involved in cell wall biosynthesis